MRDFCPESAARGLRYSWRLSLGLMVLPVLAASWAPRAQAQGNFPTKPIVIVASHPPGGTTDAEVRVHLQKLMELTKWKAITDYRAGAGGTIANTYVAKSAPDGHTLLPVTPGFSVSPAFYNDLPYDPIKDFTAVTMMTRRPVLLLAHPGFPVKNVKDLVAYAKANPGKINWGTSAVGGSTHLAGAWLESLTGMDVTFVFYKGGSTLQVDALAGRVDIMTNTFMSGLPLVRSGKMRALAVAGPERSALLPDVPTVIEQGVPGYDVSSYLGFIGPANIPAPILNRLNAELAKVAKSPDVVQKFGNDGIVTVGSTPAEFKAHLEREISRWKKLVADTGIKID
jgi:tripartite-type tricarboxylate transporter receptor subunit TctC